LLVSTTDHRRVTHSDKCLTKFNKTDKDHQIWGSLCFV